MDSPENVDPPRFTPIETLAHEGGLTEVIVQLRAVRVSDGHSDPAGTAVIIGQRLALTAKHVLEDYAAKYGMVRGSLSEDGGEPAFGIQAFSLHPDERSGSIFSVKQVAICRETDLAILLLEPANDTAREFPWRKAHLDLEMPKVGTSIVAFGYFDAKDETPPDGSIRILREFAGSTGRVTDVHPRGRDTTQPHACFATDAEFRGGMSGGPVFNGDGRLCGVVRTCMPFDDGTFYSTVTLLYPLFGTLVGFPREGYSSPYTVHDLATKGLLDVHGLDRIKIDWDGLESSPRRLAFRLGE